MYKDYFGLKDLPFSIAPDPRYLYMSNQHRDALAHLLYGINSDSGFILLTGEVGTGKTTVCRCLLEQVPPDCDIAFILNPKVTTVELLASVCDEFRIAYPAGNDSIKVFTDAINAFLLAAHAKGRRTVLIIEEAQNLGPDVLEQIRLLTNLETNQKKLLQIIMLGQPELRDMLARDELRQLSQRITARYHLGPLLSGEVAAYISHRLAVAGVRGKLFPDAVISRIHILSKGIPRLINLLCDRALLGTYAQGREEVDSPTLIKASCEVFGEDRSWKNNVWLRRLAFYIPVLVIIPGIILPAIYYYRQQTLTDQGRAAAVISNTVAPKVLPDRVEGKDIAQGNGVPRTDAPYPVLMFWSHGQRENRSHAESLAELSWAEGHSSSFKSRPQPRPDTTGERIRKGTEEVPADPAGGTADQSADKPGAAGTMRSEVR